MNGLAGCARVGACVGALSLAAIGVAGGDAHASLVKPNGSPPLDMPNALALETAPPLEHASVGPHRGATCAAAAVRLGRLGTRLVTARHCATQVLEVFDERFHVVPVGRTFVSDAIDVAVLEVREPLPWEGLEPRRADTLQPGERLCAWRFERAERGLERQRICGRFLGRVDRDGATPLIKLSHPYPPGTSGSALVDTEGRIAGVVVASDVDSGLAEPIDAVLTWAESTEHGRAPQARAEARVRERAGASAPARAPASATR